MSYSRMSARAKESGHPATKWLKCGMQKCPVLVIRVIRALKVTLPRITGMSLVHRDHERGVPESQVRQATTYANMRAEHQREIDEATAAYFARRPTVDKFGIGLTNQILPAPMRSFCKSRSLYYDVNVDPNAHPPVREVSAPAFSETGWKLEAATPADSNLPPPATKAVPKTPPASLLMQPKPTPVAQTTASTSSSSETTGDPILNATHEPPTCQPDSDPKLLGTSIYRSPKKSVIPPSALVEEVDPMTFPKFAEWKRRMNAAPQSVQTDAQTTDRYHPLGNIIGFETPVDNMSEQVPA
eukprot:4751172-Amphidinium_carterae.1